MAKLTAECRGLDLDRETEKFRDWEFKDARSDWNAAWRTWMRTAYDRRSAPRPTYADQKAAAAHVTVSSDDAQRTAQYLNDQRLTPEQKAKADEARKKAMASIGRIAA